MTTRKHNDFLDFEGSDDEEVNRGYNSDEKVVESKGRAVKRRRTAKSQDFLLDSTQDSEVEDDEREETPQPDIQEDENTYLDTTSAKSSSKSKAKEKKIAKRLSSKPRKEGVVYFSSLPPYLKPRSLKSLLEKRGFEPVTKVFLAPVVPSNSGPRRRSNKRKLYGEGWVAFASKKTAKIAAQTLNACTIGGRGYYADDVWNMKYLKGFTWSDLIDTVRRERSEREAKQRIEDSRARKEEKIFLAGVEAGRVADGMARKNEEKRKRRLEAGEGDQVDVEPPKLGPVRRRFTQNDVVTEKEDAAIGDDARRVLGKIF